MLKSIGVILWEGTNIKALGANPNRMHELFGKNN